MTMAVIIFLLVMALSDGNYGVVFLCGLALLLTAGTGGIPA